MAGDSGMRDFGTTLVLVLLLLAALALFVLGAYLAVMEQAYTLLGIALVAVIVAVAAMALAGRREDPRLMAALRRQNDLLESINNNLLVSERSKQVMFRRRDRDAVRKAIAQDIEAEEYAAALVLVDVLAKGYGDREQAERYRTQIHQAQQQRREQMVKQGLARVSELCRASEWEKAQQEALRLTRLFPAHGELEQLPQQVAEARERRKHQLERAFLEAAERDDVEKAMDLLKELDQYLTPEEARPYMETARGVVGKKRENLGVQFKLAVQDRDWVRALAVGENIVREFPNSQFANEVRSMIDQLRERAAQQRAAGNV